MTREFLTICALSAWTLLLSSCAGNSSTRILEAAASGNYGTVKLCLQDGSPINASDIKGRTPLMLASEKGYQSVVDLLMEQEGIDLIAQDREGWTALMYACAEGHISVAVVLLDADVPTNTANKFGNTALMWAVRRGHKDVVALLLKEGADLSAKNKLGWDAQYMAKRFKHPDIAELLQSAMGGASKPEARVF